MQWKIILRLLETISNYQDEIVRLQADKAAISQTASGYLHEIEALQARCAAIAPTARELNDVGIFT